VLKTNSVEVIVLPATVHEGDERESDEDKEPADDDIPSHQQVLADRVKKVSPLSADVESTGNESWPDISAVRIIKRMRSGDSTASYNELDDVEAQTQPAAAQSHPRNNRGSRVSWLFGRVSTPKKGSLTGTNDVMAPANTDAFTARKALESKDDEEDLPAPPAPRKSNAGPSRFSFLKNIVQSYKEEQGPDTLQGADFGFRGVRGTKGTPVQQNMPMASTRSTRMFGDGLGSAVGGVAVEGLIVRPVEFTLRQLEVSLREVLPVASLALSHQTSDRCVGNERSSDQSLFRNDATDPLHLILDGMNISREKHVEMLIWLLKTPLKEGIVMMRKWASVAVGNEIPDHWDDFVQENSNAFVSRVKARHMRLPQKRAPSDPSRSSSPLANHSIHGHDSFSSMTTTSSSDAVGQRLPSEGGTDMHLVGLSVRYCDITARGVGILVDSLRWNHHLAALDLCGNSIDTDASAASLGQSHAHHQLPVY
jgi:hypothetical protein